MATLISLPGGLFCGKGFLDLGGVELDNAGRSAYSFAYGNTLTIEIEPGQDGHGHRLLVLCYRTALHQVWHGCQNMSAVDPVGLAAEHEIVASGAPGCLLGDVDIRHAVLGKEASFLCDDQRR